MRGTSSPFDDRLLARSSAQCCSTFTTTYTAALSTLAATTALIVPGTGTPNPAMPNQYMENAVTYYVDPQRERVRGPGMRPAVRCPYTAQFWPFPLPGWGGLSGAKWNDSVASGVGEPQPAVRRRRYPTTARDDPVVIFGYSRAPPSQAS